jgi:hypothetical protein
LNPSAFSVRLHPSPALAFLLLLGHLLGLLAIFVTLDGLALLLAAGGVAVSCGWAIGAVMLRSADSPIELQLKADGRAAWRDRSGRWHESASAGGAYVSPWLVLVALSGPDLRRKWVVVAGDSASAEERRQLRVWLRWQPGGGAPDAK